MLFFQYLHCHLIGQYFGYSDNFVTFICRKLSTYSSCLNSLRPSLLCSNLMSGGVPVPSSGHRAVRIFHYIIFRKTSFLFLLHLRLIHLPPLAPKPYALPLPPDHDLWGSWTPLLCQFNVKIFRIAI